MADVTEVSNFNDIPLGVPYRVFQITEDTDIDKTIDEYRKRYSKVGIVYKITRAGKKERECFYISQCNKLSILQRAKNKFFIDIASSVIAKRPVYLDTETTGLGNNDEIIELAIIDFNGDVLFNHLIKPLRLIVRNITSIHGISNETVKNSKKYSEYIVEINTILKNRLICCYNVEFDMRMITQTNKIYHFINNDIRDTFCVMKFFSQMNGNFNRKFGDYTSVSLESVAKELRVLTGKQTHRALDDAIITRRSLMKICEHNTEIKQESMF